MTTSLTPFSDVFIQRHRPICWLHSEEPHFPADVEDYIRFCTINEVTEENALVVPETTIIDNLFLDQFQRPPGSSQVTFQLRPQSRYVVRGDTFLNNVPVYVYAPPGTVNGKIYLHYIYFFNRNADFDVFFTWVQQGGHDSDWERVTLEVDETTMQVERVFFGAHSQGNGRWVNWTEAEREGQRVVAYFAKGSHGIYPAPGNYIRIFGAANDLCNKGTRWSGARVQRIFLPDQEGYVPETMGFMNFRGDWGFGQVSSLVFKDWFSAEGAAAETDSAAPRNSGVNWRLDLTVSFSLIAIVSILAIVGWIMWAMG